MLAPAAISQVPDTLTSFDPGGRPLGMGSVGYVTGADTLSSLMNPAGLGYIDRPTLGIAMRNLPTSRSVASGDFNDPFLNTRSGKGNLAFTHVGWATPMGHRGVVGVAFTTAGYLNEHRTGNGLSSGPLTIDNYDERVLARTDLLTLSFGQAAQSQTSAWGAGLVFALQHIQNRQTGGIFSGNTQVGLLDVDNDETGTGLGFVFGFQSQPSSNMSFGVSFRSEIDLQNNTNTQQLYDKIPARIMAGISGRRDSIRGGSDYLVYGVEVSHFLKGGASTLMDRDAQTVGGVGLEYNYVAGFGRLPLRVGFHAVPSGGNGFGSRNSITFGLGFRPAGSDLSIDIGFGRPEGSASDLSVMVSFKFK